jgi:thioester reductase-like protein
MTRDARHKNSISPTPAGDLEKRIAELSANDDQIRAAIPAPAPTEVFRDAVRAAKIGAGEDIPHLSASLIDKYVADLKCLGLLANHEGKSA